ncbi:MAG: hypothetical protein KR126chlam2_01013 [Chlamydiae bacterium]|nr:hypothetical protein [Chlamydiota bacterium]
MGGQGLNKQFGFNYFIEEDEEGNKLVPEFTLHNGVKCNDPAEALFILATDLVYMIVGGSRIENPVQYILEHPYNRLSPASFLEYLLSKNEYVFRGENKYKSRIFEIENSTIFSYLLTLAKTTGTTIDFNLASHIAVIHGIRYLLDTPETLFNRMMTVGSEEIIQSMFAEDDNLIVHAAKKQLFTQLAFKGNEQQQVRALLMKMRKQRVEISEDEQWVIKAFENDTSFEKEAFDCLARGLKFKLYTVANIYLNYNFIKKIHPWIRERGWMDLSLPTPPSIVSPTMNAAEVDTALGAFLRNLRRQDLLLTAEEFEERKKTTTFIKKSEQIERIWGRDYIEETASRLGLTRIKVPKKVAVIEKGKSEISFLGEKSFRSRLNFDCDELCVWAEEIKEVDRKATREELTQFLDLVEAVHYYDFTGVNFLVAKDGIYCIDTEFNAFKRGKTHSSTMSSQLSQMVAKEDVAWINEKLSRRRQEYRTAWAEESERDELQEGVERRLFEVNGSSIRSKPFTFPVADILSAKE